MIIYIYFIYFLYFLDLSAFKKFIRKYIPFVENRRKHKKQHTFIKAAAAIHINKYTHVQAIDLFFVFFSNNFNVSHILLFSLIPDSQREIDREKGLAPAFILLSTHTILLNIFQPIAAIPPLLFSF